MWKEKLYSDMQAWMSGPPGIGVCVAHISGLLERNSVWWNLSYSVFTDRLPPLSPRWMRTYVGALCSGQECLPVKFLGNVKFRILKTTHMLMQHTDAGQGIILLNACHVWGPILGPGIWDVFSIPGSVHIGGEIRSRQHVISTSAAAGVENRTWGQDRMWSLLSEVQATEAEVKAAGYCTCIQWC